MAMTPDEQSALSRKHLALPVCFVPLPDGRWAMFAVRGHERTLGAIGTWSELEAFVPALTKGAVTPTWEKPNKEKALEILKGLKL